jgi:triacylglycerol esterase/lipase EstA (alpha/beta hydrolase family)
MVSSNHKYKSRKNGLVVRSLCLDPSVIYNKKKMMQNISQMLRDSKHSSGIVADGVSRILIIANYDNQLKFSVTGPSNIDNGWLNSINELKSINDMNDPKSNSIVADPINFKHHRKGSVVAVIYKGPHYVNMKKNTKHLAVTISVSDIKKKYIQENIIIKVYRVPVILVHGVWSDEESSWENTVFKQSLEGHGFWVATVDYKEHNAKTFDPCAEPEIGNPAIAALKSRILEVLDRYNKQHISVSKVDIIAHSMGGLIARGLCQQNGYKAKENYMEGQIRRLITIGSPHFGAGLAGILYRQKDNWYSNKDNKDTLWNSNYGKDSDYRSLQLKDIYSKVYGTPIDKGAVESLAPDSAAYSNLLPTSIKSYAIAGSWKPKANMSHKDLEEYYRNILGNPFFSLDRDGLYGDNDLQVSVSSQLGGLDGKRRSSVEKNPPKYGAIYENTLHSSWFIKDDNDKVTAELQSCLIREDIANLLGSSDDNFADIIGGISETLGLANKNINEKAYSKPDSNTR